VAAAHGESAGIDNPALANSSRNTSAALRLDVSSSAPAAYESKNASVDFQHTGSYWKLNEVKALSRKAIIAAALGGDGFTGTAS